MYAIHLYIQKQYKRNTKNFFQTPTFGPPPQGTKRMKKIIASVLLSLAIATSAFATPIFSGTGLVDPQTVRDNVTLTYYGDIEQPHTGFGVWEGYSEVLTEDYNVIVFDLPVTDFTNATGLKTDLNGGDNTFTFMNSMFTLNQFEAAIFVEETFNRFSFQTVGYGNYSNYLSDSVWTENIYLGKYEYTPPVVNPPSTDVPAPASASLLALGLLMLCRKRKQKNV